ncbi:hypothetical protein [Chryseobacterium viscerum]|uniref:hypothetical protein n=1 Tax=Chryseobacterium viscerum TaxID=1037377 RepID=UPI00222273A6|nr:hypothetical protein [Chryseobacterium viscerum]MCW1964610.1 hypothetical protein [Chryseobacterium viscerum]
MCLLFINEILSTAGFKNEIEYICLKRNLPYTSKVKVNDIIDENRLTAEQIVSAYSIIIQKLNLAGRNNFFGHRITKTIPKSNY